MYVQKIFVRKIKFIVTLMCDFFYTFHSSLVVVIKHFFFFFLLFRRRREKFKNLRVSEKNEKKVATVARVSRTHTARIIVIFTFFVERCVIISFCFFFFSVNNSKGSKNAPKSVTFPIGPWTLMVQRTSRVKKLQ